MKDVDFIREKFNQDGLKAPESLSEDRIRTMLEGTSEGKEEGRTFEHSEGRPRSRRWRMASLVAAFLLVAGLSVPKVADMLAGVPDTGASEEGLYLFQSDGEVRRLVSSIRPKESGGLSFFRKNTDEYVEYAVEDAAESSDLAAGSMDAGDTGFSSTYVQVDGVDEADIIKTDGRHLYHITGEGDVRILKAEDGEVRELARLSQFEDGGLAENLYLDQDHLIVVGTEYAKDEPRSFVTTYDISNPAEPEEVQRFYQSGMIVSSRLTDGRLYLVTNDYVGGVKRYLPFVSGQNGYDRMSSADIASFPNPTEPVYVVVSAVDVRSGKELRSRSAAVLGASNEIYCNTEHLYITSPGSLGNQSITRVARVDLNDGRVRFDGACQVRGWIDNQFSMDEREGCFRIATTSQRNGRDVNNLFVLDADLEKVGEVTGFARNEHIEAVRFIGDRAYVITYEQTDPLFILDLSDPNNPKIDGSVKIDGFSTLLAPADEDTLLGIGYATRETEWGIVTDGLKLVLFDIADPSHPKVLDEKVLKDYSSTAQQNHHALLALPEQSFGIPYSYYREPDYEEDIDDDHAEDPGDESLSSYHGGVMTFRAGEKLEDWKDYETGTEGVSRVVRIGGYLYALDENDAFHGIPIA